MELEIAIFNIMAKTRLSPEEVENLTVAELLEISKDIRIKEGEAMGFKRLEKKEIVLNKQNANRLLEAIDSTRRIAAMLPKFKIPKIFTDEDSERPSIKVTDEDDKIFAELNKEHNDDKLMTTIISRLKNEYSKLETQEEKDTFANKYAGHYLLNEFIALMEGIPLQ